MTFNFVDFALHVRIGFADPCKYNNKPLRDIAKEVGISAPTLSRATHGKRLDIDTVITLCFFLDLDIADYFIY